MNIVAKCPKCGQILNLQDYNEKVKCTNCQTPLKITLDNLGNQKKKIRILTILCNIPALILSVVAFFLGVRVGYIAAGILIYQIIWVTLYRRKTMQKLKQ